MLIGYVSDERYVALPDVLFEFTNGRGSWETRSRLGLAENFKKVSKSQIPAPLPTSPGCFPAARPPCA